MATAGFSTRGTAEVWGVGSCRSDATVIATGDQGFGSGMAAVGTTGMIEGTATATAPVVTEAR
ncbi:hypothetical protein GCM10010472_30550 [Pseudonocardia halophobica]|uniref:Uncharacterized protein n=1 Tax=Pseudonocardia halophobica TaxID=29401 RepID=A0A9W6NU19_9PSEU|nr:hypothetical protein GCM10017577_04540 [Pseudonocardia halophobica]